MLKLITRRNLVICHFKKDPHFKEIFYKFKGCIFVVSLLIRILGHKDSTKLIILKLQLKYEFEKAENDFLEFISRTKDGRIRAHFSSNLKLKETLLLLIYSGIVILGEV